ncbi:hypothetical protein [Natrononativus amylolyticus]|uniref:hypothetical protein n=1 Tax=Natrononativus amylolyticus TaxID=2963434 RepID=UPI0020CDDA33|nr:hypothetical protein [Natrononativus amylolyticus]
MKTELFGVFGEYEGFSRHRSRQEFDVVVEGPSITVGVRDPHLGTPGRSAVADTDSGSCLVWGEAFPPDAVDADSASWLLEAYRDRGRDALSQLNGSFIAVIDTAEETIVATDPIRSWECFYTDDHASRVFGTNAAAVARTIDRPTVDRTSLREFMHVGMVFGEETLLSELSRVPFDGYLTATDVGGLERFVYDPQEFDYVSELARRLRRAIARRSGYPGSSGLLLSAGYDSRLLLSQVPSIEECFTVGHSDNPEIVRAGKLANQYGATHTVFEPDQRYLYAGPEKVEYAQGIKESLHIHHAGYADGIDVDTIYHGLLCDTLIRGHFLERKAIDLFGKSLPLPPLESNPDPAAVLADRFGYVPEKSEAVVRHTNVGPDDPHSFVLESIREQVETHAHRGVDVHTRLTCAGIANQPSIPFRTHLADNYLESMLVTDVELLDWHLTTPPEHHNTRTFLEAIKRLDDDILRHTPPDRPFESQTVNAVQGFLRKKAPFARSPRAWPDRFEMFDRYDLDQVLFPDQPSIHELPPRHKLRVNDVTGWLEHCITSDVEFDELFAPSPSDGTGQLTRPVHGGR